MLITYIKSYIRDLVPVRYQVPVKYFYNWLHNDLEKEMYFLNMIVKRQDRVIDVGGNRGSYTYRLWKIGANVEVFEPNPACASVLTAWSIGKSNVNIHSVALSNTTGVANLHIPVDVSGVEHDASASIENNDFTNTRDESVVLKTLDSYSFQDVSMIKIDVEGHEHSVIEGALNTLRSSFPALLIEIEQRHSTIPVSDVFFQIKNIGYQGYYLKNGILTSLESFDVNRDQVIENFRSRNADYINNFLFLHQSKLDSGEYTHLVKSQVGM